MRYFAFSLFLKKYDPNWLLFFINVALVPIGYWAANYSNSYFLTVRQFRTVVLLGSLGYLLLQSRVSPSLALPRNDFVVGIFVLLLIPSVIFSPAPIQKSISLLSLATFLYYIWLFHRNVALKHSPVQNHFMAIAVFRVCYALPIILYFVQKPSLYETNIYGHHHLGLISNNFGWAASFYLLLTIDRIQNFPQRIALKYLNLASIIPALYLVFISGSRSAVLAVVVSASLHLLRSRRLNPRVLVAILTSSLLLYALMHDGQNFALMRKGLPLDTSYLKNETRLYLWKSAYRTIRNNPETLLIGAGLNNSKKNLVKDGFKSPQSHLHNTYINYLWEGGIFCFIWILAYFLIVPMINYYKFDAVRYSYPLHPFIIALFDHQLGPGQFMAFPMVYISMFYLAVYKGITEKGNLGGV